MKLLDILSRFFYGMTAEEARRIFAGEDRKPPDKTDAESVYIPPPPQDDTFAWG